MADQGKIMAIEVDQLELDLANPRHKPFKRPAQAIEYLVLKEKVVELAEDIAKEGTNPMDLLGVVRKKGTGKRPSYIAVEGNRRVCALMLLHDPERIPRGISGRAKMIERLETAARRLQMENEVRVVLFGSKKAAKPWVDRMHLRDGRSRRQWSADQQERAMGGGRNRDAAAILDAALARGLISEADRTSKLTTVQRYVGNPTMRKALGLIRDKERDYWIDRELNDFSALLETFLDDMRSGHLSSRSNAADVIRYADGLLERTGVGDQRTVSEPLAKGLEHMEDRRASQVDESSQTPGEEDSDDGATTTEDGENLEDDEEAIRPRSKIGGTSELETAFVRSGNQKLQSLYVSCTNLVLRHHCPIVTVGLWSLFESLAALYGGDGTTFEGYFNHNRLENEFGFSNKVQRKNIVAALKRLTEKGNSTKHSAIAASFDGNQLANDFDVLAPLLLAVLKRLK